MSRWSCVEGTENCYSTHYADFRPKNLILYGVNVWEHCRRVHVLHALLLKEFSDWPSSSCVVLHYNLETQNLFLSADLQMGAILFPKHGDTDVDSCFFLGHVGHIYKYCGKHPRQSHHHHQLALWLAQSG